MSIKISRRDFAKLTGLGLSASIAGILAKEFTSFKADGHLDTIANPTLAIQNGVIATTCPGCRLGCGMLATVLGGVLQKVAGNPEHPVNQGLLCSTAEKMVKSYQHLGRFTGPVIQTERCTGKYYPVSWAIAEKLVEQALCHKPSCETVILTDYFPSHLNDLLTRMAIEMGGLKIYGLSEPSLRDGELRLLEASQKLFGISQIPYFDTEHTDMVFSFGMDGSETWLSSFSKIKGLQLNGRSVGDEQEKWFHFSSQKPDVSVLPGTWIPVKADCEAQVATAFCKLIISARDTGLPEKGDSDIQAISRFITLPKPDILRLITRFLSAGRRLVFPGKAALKGIDGFQVAEAALKLNVTGEQGLLGGIFFRAPAPVYPNSQQSFTSSRDLQFLLERMRHGKVTTLLLHGSTHLAGQGVLEALIDALEFVPQVISFNSSPDELTCFADYIFPDHHILESWGYQKNSQGSDRAVVSSFRPVFQPAFETRATVDILLAATKRMGGTLATALPFQNEMDYLRSSLSIVGHCGGYDQSIGHEDPVGDFYKRGGWWPEKGEAIPPVLVS